MVRCYAEWHYVKCHNLFIVMLNVFMLGVVMLGVATPSGGSDQCKQLLDYHKKSEDKHSSLFCCCISFVNNVLLQ
jgi:hypothetical protein